MQAKEKYLEQAEIKVKNLLSDLYESESKMQKQIFETGKKHNQKIEELKNQYKEIKKRRTELVDKFKQLKDADRSQWGNVQKDFDMLIQHIEGDKKTFIKNAESALQELGSKILDLENRATEAATDVKNDLIKQANDLKISKKELKEKIDSVKNDSTEKWREIKHWFIEKTKSLKDYLPSYYQEND